MATRIGRAVGTGNILIVAAFAVGMLPSMACLAAPQQEKKAVPVVDASQLGPVATQPADADAAPADDDGTTADEGAQDAQEQEDAAAAEVVAPTGPLTQLPTGNATLSQLLRLWGVFGDQVGAGCASLHIGDLRCLAGEADLDMLTRFNRPALLLLVSDGKEQWVLLSELGAKEAVLAGAEGVRRMPRDLLAELWQGRFKTIWRSTAGTVMIRRGMRGKAVGWLQQKLTLAADADEAGQQDAPVVAYFDKDMEARVRHFQLMHGLEPDGLVGPRTQIMLNGLSPDASVPTLTPKQESKD